MAFLKALLKMKREQQRESFQSRLSRRSYGPITMHPQITPAPTGDEHNDRYPSAPSSRTKQYKAIHVPVAKPQILNGFPKQFILARPETPNSSDFDSEDEDSKMADDEEYNPSTGKIPTAQQKSERRQRQQSDRFDKEYFNFSDLDYEMPQEVREILHEEGLDPLTVESWLHKAEMCHRRALAMRRFQTAKYLKATKKNATLPPIRSTHPTHQTVNGNLEKEGSDRRRSASPAIGKNDVLPDIVPVQQEEDVEKAGDKVCEDMTRVLTEAEDVKWRCEQQLERMAMPSYDYKPPRLVLISSRVAWCHALAKAVRRDSDRSRVLYLVYDFERWTFQALLEAARQLLDTDCRGCKARSVFLLCKGGPGYFYLLRNFVMTPQKMSRPRYKAAREFWHAMGKMVSKLDPEEAKIHLVGSDLENNRQGQKLIRAIWKTVHPNKVEVLSHLENSAKGQDCIELYFDYRKYLLWRSKPASSFSLLEGEDLARSWSSIEEEALRKERVRQIMRA